MLSLLLALSTTAPHPEDRDETERYRRRVTPIVEVARDATPAVVFIRSETTQVGVNWFGQRFQQNISGSGSGVVIHKDGFIITNYHVVAGARRLQVEFDKKFDSNVYDADVVAYVAAEDLALLKITGEHAFPTIPLGTSDDLMIGETVIAIGNPYGQTHTVSEGILSGMHRAENIPTSFGKLSFDDLIQTSADIYPGNSGGPLLNINGELIGINNAVIEGANGIGFAIPVDQVRRVLEERMLAPNSGQNWMGFEVVGDEHLQVAKIVPGGPGEDAGLKTGDCIVAVAGTPVANYGEYKLARVGLAPMKDVELKVERAGQSRIVRMKPWNRADGILFERLGLKVKTVEGQFRSYNQITDIRPESPAAQLGLKPNDAIDAVRPLSGARARQPLRVPTREHFANLISEMDPGMKLEMDVYRDTNGNGVFDEEELHRGTLTLR